MRIVFFDTETTGGSERDRLLQLAVKERGNPEPLVNAVYKPPLPISLDSMTIHHITEKMVADRPAFLAAPEYADVKSIFEHPETISVAHNAAFDIGMLAREEIMPSRTICTYKVARSLDEAEVIGKYTLQYLRYFHELEIEAIAHDAFGDVMVLEAVFEKLLADMSAKMGSEELALYEMMSISARPMLFTTLRFGKYRGKKIGDVAKTDRGYLEWLLNEKRKDPAGESDWIYTLEYHLKDGAKHEIY